MQDFGLPELAGFMKDLWQYLKKYYIIRGGDDYWRAVAEEADALYQKHKTQLCQDLIVACVADIERRGKEKNGS